MPPSNHSRLRTIWPVLMMLYTTITFMYHFCHMLTQSPHSDISDSELWIVWQVVLSSWITKHVLSEIPSSLPLAWSCRVIMQAPQLKGTLPYCHSRTQIKNVAPCDYCLANLPTSIGEFIVCSILCMWFSWQTLAIDTCYCSSLSLYMFQGASAWMWTVWTMMPLYTLSWTCPQWHTLLSTVFSPLCACGLLSLLSVLPGMCAYVRAGVHVYVCACVRALYVLHPLLFLRIDEVER